MGSLEVGSERQLSLMKCCNSKDRSSKITDALLGLAPPQAAKTKKQKNRTKERKRNSMTTPRIKFNQI